jgi:hypothetical protein
MRGDKEWRLRVQETANVPVVATGCVRVWGDLGSGTHWGDRGSYNPAPGCRRQRLCRRPRVSRGDRGLGRPQVLHREEKQWGFIKIRDLAFSFECKYLFTVISFLKKNCTITLKYTRLVHREEKTQKSNLQ